MRRGFLFGLPLGLLQLALVFLEALFRIDWYLMLLVSYLLYLVVPVWPGRSAAQQAGKITAGAGAGWLVGFISASFVGLALLAWLILFPPMPTPEGRNPGAAVLGVVIIFFILVFNFLGTLLAWIGGAIGGALARRSTQPHSQRHQPTTE